MSVESIRAKLKTIARDTDKTFMELFKQLTFERFLSRVASSKYRKNLIFKGGLCLKQYVDTSRETKDIDFLIKELDGKIETITSVFKSIAEVDLEDEFKFHSVESTILDQENKKYPGFRLRIEVNFGNVKDRLQVDIGIGDIVDEYEMGLDLVKYNDQPLLGNGGVSLYAYPPEFIFSEKFQAIIELKTLNSRMKDYFDCYSLIREDVMNPDILKDAINKTFEKRNTEIQLIEDFSTELSSNWELFRKKIDNCPETIGEVIKGINNYLGSNRIL